MGGNASVSKATIVAVFLAAHQATEIRALAAILSSNQLPP